MANQFISWENRSSVGIEVVDRQHRHLINLTNKLIEACLADQQTAAERFRKTIKEAVVYAKVHFKTEEELMQKYRYPEYPIHRAEHLEFVKKILDEANNYDDSRKFIANNFAEFLKDWILSHIAITDRNFAPFLQKAIAADPTAPKKEP